MNLRVLRVSSLVAALGLSACTSTAVPTYMLPTVYKMPDIDLATKKPSVYVDVKYFSGNPPDYEMPDDEDAILPMIDNTLNKSNMFGHITYRVTEATDLRMRVIVYVTHASQTDDMCIQVRPFPCIVRNHYQVVLKIRDNADTLLTKVENEDQVDSSYGVASLQTGAMSYNAARSITLENQLRAALVSAYASGKIAVPPAAAVSASAATP